jgi:type IV pilus assembly protein PilY1
MHSTPEAINFGKAESGDQSQDIRIVFGTNAGFLHMIDGQTGEEAWAFFPKELGHIIPVLYDNNPEDPHPYGVDGRPAVWITDTNDDGDIDKDDGDQVLLFFGLRRGASVQEGPTLGYYALDISDPDNPSFLWQVGQTELPELGQSWSTPSPTFVPGHDNPVVVVGAGYDRNKDAPGVGTPDSVGRGIYVLDALDGSLVWSVSPAGTSETNLNEPGLVDSVPADVTVFDSNGDHVTDRMYFPDTGGNVWRVDLIHADKSNWSIFRLASLGGDTEENDRRFFYKIGLAVTKSSYGNYEALALGSGNRAHPLDRVVDNRFFTLRDTGIWSAFHVPNDGDPDKDACADPNVNPQKLPCREIPPVITEVALYDATDNLIQDGDKVAQETAALELLSKKGWFIELERTGEKSLARAITLKGRTFFTTYVPPDPLDPDVDYVCRPSEGKGFLYAVGLHDATAQYDWSTGDHDGAESQETAAVLDKEDRSKSIKDHIPDHPAVYFGESEIGLVGVGAGSSGSGIERTGLSLAVSPVYWMQEAD